jgi:hypothetical protein
LIPAAKIPYLEMYDASGKLSNIPVNKDINKNGSRHPLVDEE